MADGKCGAVWRDEAACSVLLRVENVMNVFVYEYRT